MASNHLGLWQQTSEQAVKQRHQRSYGTATTTTTANATTTSVQAVGIKRSHGGNSGNSSSIWAQQPLAKRQALASMPKLPSRLTASAIVDVKDDVLEDGNGDHGAEPRPDWLPAGVSEYSQRQAISATPGAAADRLLSLDHPAYDLPPQLVSNMADLGIRSIYPWQKQCLLRGPGLLDGSRSLIYSAPTGGGKSLVADVLMLKQIMRGYAGAGRNSRQPKALLVLPFVALVQEKVRWLRRVVQGLTRAGTRSPGNTQHDDRPEWLKRQDEDAIRVVGFFGGAKIKATWADFDIGVATIEKANSLVNAAIDECTISDLKVVVLDELHMIDDGHRGYLMELMATKLLCLENHVQIVGMSATMKNIELLAKWLGAHSYQTHYRPVPVEEHLVYEGDVFDADLASAQFLNTSQIPQQETPIKPLRTIHESEHRELHDPVTNAIVSLASETALAGFGALVFSSSRASSESDAVLISRVLPVATELDSTVLEARLNLLGDLQSLSSGLDTNLSKTILAGVGFHHAGMTTEERDLVANGFDTGVLKVCVATCGLAAGINLPARRVILHNARMGRDLVGPAMLRQMRGRAGRKGKDEIGETYLCCRGTDVDDIIDLMHAELPRVSSSLLTDRRCLQRALLEVVTVRLATSRESLDDYVRKTLLYHSSSAERDGGGNENDDDKDSVAKGTEDSDDEDTKPGTIWKDVEQSLESLQTMDFITVDQYGNFQPTRLGKAVVASALDPEDAVFVHSELERALQAFVLDGEMHVLYTFTPVHDTLGAAVNWRRFWEEMEGLDDSGMRVLRFLGLKPSIVSKMLRGGTLKENTPEEKATARVYRRFYLALQLRDLCNEMPIHRVAQKYETPRGAVQNLAQTCEGFAAGMIKFCEHLGWGAMASVLEHFVDRLKAGAKADLLALARIAFVKSRTARVFWENGFKTVAAVANADPKELVPILLQAQGSKVRFEEKNEEKFQEKLLAKAHIITESANRIWQMEMQKDLEE